MAGGGIRVAEVRPEDFEAVAQVCLAAYGALEYALRPEYAGELGDVAGRAAEPNAVVLVAHLDGRVAGHATVVLGPSPLAEHVAPGEASLRMVAVDPALQGRGVGRALVLESLERARAAGRQWMRLYTQPIMLAAQRMYESLGFRRVPERDTTVLNGTLQLIAYEKDLRPAD